MSGVVKLCAIIGAFIVREKVWGMAQRSYTKEKQP